MIPAKIPKRRLIFEMKAAAAQLLPIVDGEKDLYDLVREYEKKLDTLLESVPVDKEVNIGRSDMIS